MKDPSAAEVWLCSDLHVMDLSRRVGTCLPFFFLAIIFDILGLALLFVGIFGDLRLRGRFYGDFLIYTGSVVLFSSLACWLMWYVGNIRLSEQDRERRNNIALLARKISERLSQKLKGEDCVKCVLEDESPSHAETPPPKQGKVTWGKSTVYVNEGYDSSMDSVDSPSVKKSVD